MMTVDQLAKLPLLALRKQIYMGGGNFPGMSFPLIGGLRQYQWLRAADDYEAGVTCDRDLAMAAKCRKIAAAFGDARRGF